VPVEGVDHHAIVVTVDGGAEDALGDAADLPVEDDLHVVRAADVQVVRGQGLEERPGSSCRRRIPATTTAIALITQTTATRIQLFTSPVLLGSRVPASWLAALSPPIAPLMPIRLCQGMVVACAHVPAGVSREHRGVSAPVR
jgi:hypothetical protein